MTILTKDELQAIRARCEAATPSNLRLMDDGLVIEDDGSIIADFDSNHDDARLFIHARTDIPALLTHIEAQRNALAKAENDMPRALTWTTDPPKVEGWYWVRSLCPVSQVPSPATMFLYAVGMDLQTGFKVQYAGPIPTPQEPTP